MSPLERRIDAIEKHVNAAQRPTARIIYYTLGEELFIPKDDGRTYLVAACIPQNGREAQSSVMVTL